MQILSTATNAIMDQLDRLSTSASKVAKISQPPKEGEQPVNLVEETATRIAADAAIRANLVVIREEDKRLSYLINTFA